METGNTFVDGLNKPQKEAVTYCDGPSLVIAGAGSGKTRVLTHKIAYLISKGMDPHRIMALTFTNKAAAEMKERIDALLGYNASQALRKDPRCATPSPAGTLPQRQRDPPYILCLRIPSL